MEWFLRGDEYGMHTAQRSNEHLVGANGYRLIIYKKAPFSGNKIADLMTPLPVRYNLIIGFAADRTKLNYAYSAQIHRRLAGIPVKLELLSNISVFHIFTLLCVYHNGFSEQKQRSVTRNKEDVVSSENELKFSHRWLIWKKVHIFFSSN